MSRISKLVHFTLLVSVLTISCSGKETALPVESQPTEDLQPPSIPTGLAPTSVTASTVSLAWLPATDDVGVVGYKVFRDALQVGTPSSAGFDDTGLVPATSYAYQVLAFDSAGNESALSDVLTATTAVAGGGPLIETDFESGTLEGWAHEHTRNYPNNGSGKLAAPGLGGSNYAILIDAADKANGEAAIAVPLAGGNGVSGNITIEALVKADQTARTISFNLRRPDKKNIVKVSLGGSGSGKITAHHQAGDTKVGTGLTYGVNEEFTLRITYYRDTGNFKIWKNANPSNAEYVEFNGGDAGFLDIDNEVGTGKGWVDNVRVTVEGG